MELNSFCSDFAFRCPISLEIMSDPVILTSGQTFDRPSIQRWLDAGHRLCPVTNLPLPHHPPLIPNHALRSLISHFSPTTPLSSSADHHHHAALASAALSSPTFPSALSAALRLAKRDAAFRLLLSDSGAAPVLLRLAADPLRPELQDLSLRLLLHLTLDGDAARVGLAADGAVGPISTALSHAHPAAALAATLLTSLAVVEVNKCTIGAHPTAIPSLSALLLSSRHLERREAATALYELCKFPDNRPRAVRAGAVPPLVQFAASGSARAVEVLGLLTKCREGREQMKSEKDLVKILIALLLEGSSRGVEHALAVLNSVCADSEEMAAEAKRGGVLKICSRFADDDNERIVKNALGLARVFEIGQLSASCKSRSRGLTGICIGMPRISRQRRVELHCSILCISWMNYVNIDDVLLVVCFNFVK